jgi:ABC-type glycerol-3-phosphate transport system substrate-binding protein
MKRGTWKLNLALLLLAFVLTATGCSISGPKGNESQGNTGSEGSANSEGGSAPVVEKFGVTLDNLHLDNTLNGQYAGKTLTVPVMSGDFEAAINEAVPLFEQLSGAKVRVESIPGEQFTDRLQLDLSNTNRYDIVLAPIANLHSYAEAGNIERLQPYIDDLAGPSYNVDDFLTGMFETAGKYKGEIVAIPYKPDAQLLFYRKDLFEDEAIRAQYKEKYGVDLKVPETNEEMMQVAAFFTKSLNPDSPVEYGYVNTMLKGASRWLWINRGASILDENGQPNFNNEDGLKALEYTVELGKYAPKEWLQMGWDEGNQFFAAGNAAMMEQWPGLWTTVQSDTSKVKDKVGIAVTPGHTPVLGGWGIAINARSQEKELAWKFIEFVTSRDGELLKIEKTMDPTRASVYELEGVQAFNPNYAVLMESLNYAKTLADTDVPFATSELNDVTENYTQQVLTGGMAPQDALAKMEQEYLEVIAEFSR